MSATVGFRSLASRARPWKRTTAQSNAAVLLGRGGHTISSLLSVHRNPLSPATATAAQSTLPLRAVMFSTSRSVLYSTGNSENKSSREGEEGSKRPGTRSCWKCAQPIPFLAMQCSQCKAVQPVAPGANYFETLGLPPEPNFDIDVKDLRTKFFKIQQLIHPDSYSQNTNGDQIYAQQQSSFTNKAYATLKEPLPRANYILELKGVGVQEAESLDNPELLMEVMEARELLEEAQTEDEVEQLQNQNNARIEEAVKGLSKAFKESDFSAAKTLAIQLQYWIRIQNVIRDWAAGKPIVADHV